MSGDDEVVFTIDQVAAVSTAMRTALGLPPEHFSTMKFVGMISDEIEQLRTQGWSDEGIATLVHESSGSVMLPGDITQHYVPPDRRRG